METDITQKKHGAQTLEEVLFAFRLSLPGAKHGLLARWIRRYPDFKIELIKLWMEWHRLSTRPIDNSSVNTKRLERNINRVAMSLRDHSSPNQARIIPIDQRSRQIHDGYQQPAEVITPAGISERTRDWIRVVSRDDQMASLRRQSIYLVDSYKSAAIERSRTHALWGQNNIDVSVVLQRKFKNGRNEIYPSRMDEALFILQRGKVTLECAGLERPISLETNEDYMSALWLPAFCDAMGQKGLPHRTITAEGDAVGLAVCYSSAGMALDIYNESSNEVELPEMDWKGAATAVKQPVVARIPRQRRSLNDFINRHQPGTTIDEKHRRAVDDRQIRYVDLPDWSLSGNSVLRARVMEFMPRGENSDEIWLDHHKGRELFLPLYGSFTCLYAEVLSDDFEKESYRRYKNLNDRKNLSVRINNKTSTAEVLPDILLLNSNFFHGFYGMDGPAYLFHVRILAESRGFGERMDHSDTVLHLQASAPLRKLKR
jgi:hypothetical protein